MQYPLKYALMEIEAWLSQSDLYVATQAFFTKFFCGHLLSGMIFGPRQERGQMGDSCRGQSQMRGDLEKLSAEAKNAPLQHN